MSAAAAYAEAAAEGGGVALACEKAARGSGDGASPGAGAADGARGTGARRAPGGVAGKADAGAGAEEAEEEEYAEFEHRKRALYEQLRRQRQAEAAQRVSKADKQIFKARQAALDVLREVQQELRGVNARS